MSLAGPAGAAPPATWVQRSAEAQKQAARLDDVRCEAEVRRAAELEPDGAASFALLEACARLGRFRDLRLLGLRPWRRHLASMPAEEAYILASRIIATRGGSVDADVSMAQSAGLLLETLGEVLELRGVSPETQYAVVRGSLDQRQPAPPGERLSILETRRGLLVSPWEARYGHTLRRRPDNRIVTGRRIEVRTGAPLTSAKLGGEYVYLLRLRDRPVPRLGKHDTPRAIREAVLLAVFELGAPLPELASRVLDRGVDIESPEIEVYTLANGLTVMLHRDPRLPLVHVDLTYRVGALHEAPGKGGLAHLFEHMMFQGSAHVPRGQHHGLLQSRGALEVNAVTTFDQTRYFETVPRHELALALWLEADRMGFFLDALDPVALENQKRVVLNERRERVDDQPYGLASEVIAQHFYGPSHPYAGNVIGSADEIDAVTLEDVRAFYLAHYGPGNAALAIAGDFEVPEAKALVERYFGSLPPRPAPPTPRLEPRRLSGETVLEVAAPLARLPRVSLVWEGPRPFEVGGAELDLLAHILGQDGWGFLGQQLRDVKLDVREVEVAFLEHLGGSRFEIHVTTGDSVPRGEVAAQVDRALLLLERLTLGDEEMMHLARSLERSILFRLEPLAARAAVFQAYHQLLGDPARLVWDLERHQRVTAHGLQQAVKTFLTGDRLVVIAEPKRGGRARP